MGQSTSPVQPGGTVLRYLHVPVVPTWGQSAAVEQALLVVAAQTWTLGQLPPGLVQAAPVYLHRPAGWQATLLAQAAPVIEQVPDSGVHAVSFLHATEGVAEQVPSSCVHSVSSEHREVPSFEQ